jgi:hypothetical protein
MGGAQGAQGELVAEGEDGGRALRTGEQLRGTERTGVRVIGGALHDRHLRPGDAGLRGGGRRAREALPDHLMADGALAGRVRPAMAAVGAQRHRQHGEPAVTEPDQVPDSGAGAARVVDAHQSGSPGSTGWSTTTIATPSRPTTRRHRGADGALDGWPVSSRSSPPQRR